MIVVLLLVHALVAVALIGAITHQTVSVWRFKPAPARSFISRFSAVPATGYANAVVALYLTNFAIGAVLYPTYVLDVKSALIDAGMRTTVGVFQIKEHVAVIGLILLPVYWHLWRQV